MGDEKCHTEWDRCPVNRLLSDFESSIRNDLSEIDKKLDKMSTLLSGNGKKGLIEEVHEHGAFISRFKGVMKWTGGFIASVALALIGWWLRK